MINYLTNLIARNRNEVETVQPRLPSRFEPQTTALHLEASEFGVSEETETAETFLPDLEVVHLPETAPVTLPSFREQPAIEQDVETNSALLPFQEKIAPPKSAASESRGVDTRRVPPVEAAQDNQRISPFREDDGAVEDDSSFMADLSPAAKFSQPPALQVTKTDASEGLLVAQSGVEPSQKAESKSPKTPSNSKVEALQKNDETSQITRLENQRPRNRTKPRKREDAGTAVERSHVAHGNNARNTPTVGPIVKTAKAKQHSDPAAGSEAYASRAPSLNAPREKPELDAPSRETKLEKQIKVDPLAPLARPDGETLTAVSDVVRRQSPRAPQPRMIVPRSLERIRPENLRLDEQVDTGPTINISIGRVEVRATTVASTAAAPKMRHEHVLSLDQYLKERVSRGGS
jgi:hypothetical protein